MKNTVAYQFLHHLRRMNKNLVQARRNKRLAVLDIGASKVCCALIELAAFEKKVDVSKVHVTDQDILRVISVAQTQSKGIRKGNIICEDNIGRILREVLTRAEQQTDTCVDHVIVSLTGARPHSYTTTSQIQTETKHVNEDDILNAAALVRLPREQEYTNRQVLHISPVNYALEGIINVRDPRGREARMLEVDFNTLTVETEPVERLINCVSKSGLNLAGIINSGYASAIACLTKTELENGSVCIDIGEDLTSIAIMLHNNLIFAHTVQMAGKHVTQDIARGLNVNLQTAERLKTLYGGVLSTEVDKFDIIPLNATGITREEHVSDFSESENQIIFDESIDAKSYKGLKNENQYVSRSHLISIIRPRIEETLEIVRERLEEAGFSHLPNPQVVFTGGGCQIPGLLECAQKIFGYRVRIGRPVKLTGLPKSFSGPAFSTLAGLAHYATSSRQQTSELIMNRQSKKAGRLLKSVRWFRENW